MDTAWAPDRRAAELGTGGDALTHDEQHATKARNVWDEGANPSGPNQCSADTAPNVDPNCECNGTRICSIAGFFEEDCVRPEYMWDESVNPAGPNLCDSPDHPSGMAPDCECDGNRVCVKEEGDLVGRCEGEAR